MPVVVGVAVVVVLVVADVVDEESLTRISQLEHTSLLPLPMALFVPVCLGTLDTLVASYPMPTLLCKPIKRTELHTNKVLVSILRIIGSLICKIGVHLNHYKDM